MVSKFPIEFIRLDASNEGLGWFVVRWRWLEDGDLGMELLLISTSRGRQSKGRCDHERREEERADVIERELGTRHRWR